MRTVSTPAEYEGLYRQWRGQRIGLVPTMGALHEGHAALIRRARQQGEIVVVSIFVNPLQFGPNEDLSRYPRQLEADLALCRELGVDAVFCPTPAVMYPEGLEAMTTVIPPSALTERYCGADRPGHFTGVATVVLKLFNIVRPDFAVFGEKDAQQMAVIRQMVSDLNVPVEIVAHPTVREPDGLALSSRNRYLQTEAERRAALSLSRILMTIRERVRQSAAPLPVNETLKAVSAGILAEAETNAPDVEIRLQYLAAVDRETFCPAERLTRDTKVLIAAKVDNVRLIDNMDLA